MMNAQGRSTSFPIADAAAAETVSAHRGLDHEEKLIFEIGRSDVSAAFDLRTPRHSARKPSIELAPPRSTPNSVRCTAISDAAFDAAKSDAGGADARASGGAAMMTSGGCSGSISFAAAGSGGAIIDLDGISGVAGVAAGRLAAFVSGDAVELASGTVSG